MLKLYVIKNEKTGEIMQCNGHCVFNSVTTAKQYATTSSWFINYCKVMLLKNNGFTALAKEFEENEEYLQQLIAEGKKQEIFEKDLTNKIRDRVKQAISMISIKGKDLVFDFDGSIHYNIYQITNFKTKLVS